MADPCGELPPHLVEGIRLFGEGQYFLAHETLEEYWIDAGAAERPFYQGLIHLATGFHHLERGNATGARLQLSKAGRRLEGYPDSYEGVDVAGIRAFVADALGRIERQEPVTPPPLLLPAQENRPALG
ncbi:MAG: hypothetical protein NVSMB32_07420 [Actinomycetota bacterium]